MRAVDKRYRFLYKPLLFLACLVPLAWVVGGVLDVYGVLHVPFAGLGVDPVQQMLNIFGKSTLNLLMLTLLVSPLRQLTGNAHLLRLRRMLGVFAFSYALLHFTTYVVPFSGLNLHTIVGDITKRPYITIGFLALLMLIPLAVTSTNGWMRRLGRRWGKLHRLIYPIAILGVWHYWWQVKKDFSDPLRYAFILAVLLGWRVWRRWRITSRSAPPTAREKTSAAAPSPDN